MPKATKTSRTCRHKDVPGRQGATSLLFRTLAQALGRRVILRLRVKSLGDWNVTLKPGTAGAEGRSNADRGSVAGATLAAAAPGEDATAVAARVAGIVAEEDSGVGGCAADGSAWSPPLAKSKGPLSKAEG